MFLGRPRLCLAPPFVVVGFWVLGMGFEGLGRVVVAGLGVETGAIGNEVVGARIGVVAFRAKIVAVGMALEASYY